MNPRNLILPALSCVMLSCASSGGDDSREKKSGSEFKSLSQRMEESNGFAQDGDGNWKPKSDKRSSFESVGADKNFAGRGSYGTKEYKTGAFAKKSWWGNKEFGRNAYRGSTDGSRFQTTSRLSGRDAGESGRGSGLVKPYQTGTYATSSAREAGRDGIDKPSDAETDVRRGLFGQPPEVDYQEVRSLSLEQSKGILGR